MTNFIRELGPKLIRNGYPICAVKPRSKAPFGTAWNERPLTEAMIDQLPANYGVGILCGQGDTPIYALDVDSLNEDLVRAVMGRVFRERPALTNNAVRVGQAPKALYLYRGDKPGRCKMVSDFFKRDPKDKAENGHRMEILGFGQQFVAYGIYPTADGEPERCYAWTYEELDESPEFISAAELPEMTAEDAQYVLKVFAEEAERQGYRPVTGKTSSAATMITDDFDVSKLPVSGLTIAEAERVLRALKLDLGPGTNDAWVQLGMALHHQFDGSEEALALWDRISLDFGAEAYQEGECAKRWASFKDARGGSNIVTFRTYLRLYRRSVASLSDRLDETGLFARYLDSYGHLTVRLTQFRDEWAFFDEDTGWWDRMRGEAFARSHILKVYSEDLLEEIEHASDEVPEGGSKKDKSPKQKLFEFRESCLRTSSSTMDKVFRLLKANPAVYSAVEEFDANPKYFGVKNGVLDLEVGKLVPNRPELRVLRQAGTEFDPKAKCPTWDKAILQIFNDDPETVSFFYRVVGSALAGDLKDEGLMLLRGLGCNGKSLVVNIIAAVFGGYAETVGEDTLLGTVGKSAAGSARADLAKLAGARLVYCSETTENNRLKEADIKRMTGRDPISCRAPFGRVEISIRPTWRLMIVTNHPPVIRGDDDGIWRRILDVECPRNFDKDPKVKKDPGLERKIKAELPGVLNRLLEGLADYRKRGGDVGLPEKVRENVKEYRNEMDDVKAWFESTLVFDASNMAQSVGSKECFASFQRFMDRMGEDTSFYTSRTFLRRLGMLIPKERRRRAKTNTAWKYFGYRFREDDEFEDMDGPDDGYL